ncbi:MAG: GDP-mannose 4,6-dehydratase [Nitrosopumilus sp.]|nr:GDP-mannose 4,6-dehydratase [Nitrosopumilus sp.]MDH3515789.1 GDP-mannose 4,6-dehydratase [Nitrosopumilus sp.]MDH5418491.1 GDP-mannose 4,6-dehydratase [Nitrosopumilus sp.]MDH5555580.1 GDP-mannose 4,6-dehydratase [Nitrosopumilus sp.]
MKRRALVTGGLGFIGSTLAKKLYENNYNVSIYDDFSNASGKSNVPKDIKVIKGSILNYDKFKTASRKMDVVFHLAVKPLTMSFDKPEEVVKVNDYGTYLVAKACTELKCKMIHISSSEVYGSAMKIPMKEDHPLLPTTIYAGSKAASELYVRGFEKSDGLKMVIVRPFNSYGEYMRSDTYSAAIPKFYERILEKKFPIIHGTGNQTRDFTYVDDTANGIMLSDQTKNAIGDTLNIGQGKEESIKKIAKIVVKKYQEITGNENKIELKFVKDRKGDVKRHCADITHSRKILGYKPIVKLEEGISKYIIWRQDF